MRRLATVIAFERLEGRGIGTDHRDRLSLCVERQDAVRVLEQYDRFLCHPASQHAVGLGIDFRVGYARIRYILRRIEHPQAEARGEQPRYRRVDLALRDQLVLECLVQAGKLGPATGVSARAQGEHCAMLFVRGKLVALPYICQRPAIRGDKAGEFPLPAQRLLEQHIVGARRRSIDRVVSTHGGGRLAFYDGRVEGGEVSRLQVLGRGLHVELVTQLLGSAVYGKVFGRGHYFQIFRIVPLQPGDKGEAHARGEIRILSVGLLPAAPAGVAKDIDVWRPDGQAEVDAMVVVGRGIGILGSRLGRDGVSHGMHQGGVPGSSQTDRLGKDSGSAGARHAVQPLVPPGVFRDAKARNGRRGHGHLGDLLLRRQPPYQVGDALLDRQRGILKGKFGGPGRPTLQTARPPAHTPSPISAP